MSANTVDVFWDFGSCPAPAEASGYAIASRLRTLALRLGAVRSFRAYLAVSSHSDATSNGRALALRSELQSSGVSLIDSPGGKDVADKMLIADMFTHVFEKAALAPSNVIMLISSDPSYAYVLSVLQMRSQRIVLLGSGLDGVAAGLASQATAFLDWDTEILADISQGKVPWQQPGEANNTGPFSEEDRVVHTPIDRTGEERHTDIPTRPTSSAHGLDAGTQVLASLQPPDYESRAAEDSVQDTSSNREVEDGPASPKVHYSFMGSSYLTGTRDDASPPPLQASSSFRRDDADEIVSPSPKRLNTVQPIAWAAGPSWAQVAQKSAQDVWWPSDPEGSYTAEDWQPANGAKRKAASGKTDVPPEFKPLVEVLKASRGNGIPRPLWGVVAFGLIKLDKRIYEKAGVAKFIQYATMAVEKKIAQVGGESGSQWIKLHSSFKG